MACKSPKSHLLCQVKILPSHNSYKQGWFLASSLDAKLSQRQTGLWISLELSIHCLKLSGQVFIISYVGIATSLNLVVKVLIIVRSLSLFLLAVSDAELPIPFNLGFITMLNSGSSDPSYAQIVKSYALPWWQGTHQPANGGTLTSGTLDKCLEHHCLDLVAMTSEDLIGELPITPTPSPSPQLHHLSRSCVGSNIGASSATNPDLTSSAEGSANCPQCTIYRSMAGNLLTKVQSLKSFVSGIVSTTLNDTHLIQCWAMILYGLHEKVLQKELLSESQPSIINNSVKLAAKRARWVFKFSLMPNRN